MNCVWDITAVATEATTERTSRRAALRRIAIRKK